MSDPAGIIIHYGRQLKIVEDRLRMISVVSFLLAGKKLNTKQLASVLSRGVLL